MATKKSPAPGGALGDAACELEVYRDATAGGTWKIDAVRAGERVPITGWHNQAGAEEHADKLARMLGCEWFKCDHAPGASSVLPDSNQAESEVE